MPATIFSEYFATWLKNTRWFERFWVQNLTNIRPDFIREQRTRMVTILQILRTTCNAEPCFSLHTTILSIHDSWSLKMLQNALIRLKLSLSTKISGHWPADDSRWWWLSRWQWWRSAVHCLVEVCCCCTPLLLCWKSAAAALSALHTSHHAQTKPQLRGHP